MPEASAQAFPWIADLALASALYAGLLGLAQITLAAVLIATGLTPTPLLFARERVVAHLTSTVDQHEPRP